jgi:hypothetical protein
MRFAHYAIVSDNLKSINDFFFNILSIKSVFNDSSDSRMKDRIANDKNIFLI